MSWSFIVKNCKCVDFTSSPDRQQLNKGNFSLMSFGEGTQGACMTSHQLSKNFVKFWVHCHKDKFDGLQGVFVLL